MVLSITMVLAGLLFPVLSEARQRADRVISANNLRSIGLAVTMYESDRRSLPASSLLEEGRSPSELTLVYRAEMAGAWQFTVPTSGWDGLGLLWQWGYFESPKAFYAPHLLDDLSAQQIADSFRVAGDEDIHSDYHYGGHLEWDTRAKRTLSQKSLVIASDTLRRVTELNHEEGLNLVFSDGSVQWRIFPEAILKQLARPDESPRDVKDRYLPLWRKLEGVN